MDNGMILGIKTKMETQLPQRVVATQNVLNAIKLVARVKVVQEPINALLVHIKLKLKQRKNW